VDRPGLLSAGVESLSVPPDLAPPPLQRPRGIFWLSVLAALGLVACAIVALLSAILEAQYLRLIGRAIANGSLPIDAPNVEHHRRVLAVISGPIAAATGVVFVVWFHRAYWNLSRLGIFGLRYGSGWSIGAWFVPILNLFRPKGIADDIWRGSDVELPVESPLPRRQAPLTFAVWWLSFILSALVGAAGAVLLNRATTLDTLKAGSALALAGFVGRGLAALFAVGVVYEITVRQTGRIRAFEKGMLPTAPGRLPERKAAELEAMRTPGGRPCPDCGFENHAMAVSCTACHKRF
jgi:hypothetical protein